MSADFLAVNAVEPAFPVLTSRVVATDRAFTGGNSHFLVVSLTASMSAGICFLSSGIWVALSKSVRGLIPSHVSLAEKQVYGS